MSLCKLPVFGCLLLAGLSGQAQVTFAYKTPLGPVPESRFYSISLPPQLVASCKAADLSDLRIADSAGTPVPYILQTDLPAITSGSFTSYRILSLAKRDSSTELVISNESGVAISSLLLVIKNASAYRTAVLSGSDDQKNWFVIDEHIELEQNGTQSGDRFVQAILFPLSNYRFFKLIIDDRGLLPLNILQAGMYKNLAYAGKYTPVPIRTFRQTDSTDRNSYVHILFDNPYKIDKLTVPVKRPALYKRSVEVYAKGPSGYTLVKEETFSPGNHTVLFSAKTRELLVKIFNADNPPLVPDSIAAYQANQQLVAQLEKDKKYFILTGNEQVGKPDFDLAFFRDSIQSAKLQEIRVGRVQKIPDPAAVIPATGNSKWILWIIIGTVLLTLLILTFRMSKEVSKK